MAKIRFGTAAQGAVATFREVALLIDAMKRGLEETKEGRRAELAALAKEQAWPDEDYEAELSIDFQFGAWLDSLGALSLFVLIHALFESAIVEITTDMVHDRTTAIGDVNVPSELFPSVLQKIPAVWNKCLGGCSYCPHDDPDWATVRALQRVRNGLVHALGRIEGREDDQRAVELCAARFPGGIRLLGQREARASWFEVTFEFCKDVSEFYRSFLQRMMDSLPELDPPSLTDH